MTQIEYKRALVEVLEVIKFMPIEEQKIIPNSIIDTMKEEKAKDFYFSLDRTQRFDIQISEVARAILANLFKKYWATSEELNIIKAKEVKNRMEMENYKRKKYPIDKIFGKR